MKTSFIALSIVLFFVLSSPKGFACTNFIVTKGASLDQSVMITYAADSHTRYGAIAFYPAADHLPGSRCEVFHYENGKNRSVSAGGPLGIARRARASADGFRLAFQLRASQQRSQRL